MYFFYIDESGNRDPKIEKVGADGGRKAKDWIYVLAGICLFEHHWHGFEKTLNRHKSMLKDLIYRAKAVRLDLADCEIKSTWVRVPAEKARRPFLSSLTDEEITALVELYFRQLAYHHMRVFAVIVDKRHLLDYMDAEKLHRKSWELLLELVERFMQTMHPKHQAVMVTDDVSRQMNRSLAMKHAYFQDQGTTSGLRLAHICEMPMFVRSELSNGVQLADLCAYNIYRAFKEGNLRYPFFEKIAGQVWSKAEPLRFGGQPFPGLTVFPDRSPLVRLVEEFEKRRASAAGTEALE